ncbi:MAG: YkgB family protein [Nitrospiraceae bacterium]
MRTTTATATMMLDSDRPIGERLQALGTAMTRYGLVVVFVWIGAMKFSTYEANAIQPLVANSPFMSWLYLIFSVQTFSNWLGVLEVAIGLMIAARPISATVSAAGSALAAILLLGTLSFMLSTPPVWEGSLGGFPALSVAPGQFLLKDLALLGASVWTLGEAWGAREREL